MQRIWPKKCDGCDRTPEFESELFGTRLCYECIRCVASWLVKHDLLEGNPLAQELLDGVWGADSGGSIPQPNQYSVWYNTPHMFSSSSHRLVERIGS